MSTKIALLFVFASVLAMTLGAKIGPQPPASTTSTQAPPDTTTPTTTPSTTTPSTTTPSTTTPSTTTPSTTTSTTTPSTTTPIAPNTTTSATTTTSAPSTTAAPPMPEPAHVGTWTVKNETNFTCIIAQMAIQLNVTYVKTDNKMGYAIVNVPNNTAVATGTCGNDTQTLVLSWAAAGVAKLPHQITVTFERNDTTKVSMVKRIDAVLQANATEFPDIAKMTVLALVNNQTEFSTNLGMSYTCAKNQMLDLTEKGSNITVAVITVNHLQLESFHAKNDTKFSSAKDCESSSATDIVPIAVGCALVALVAIVLIAYLVGRRRSQARGYLSM